MSNARCECCFKKLTKEETEEYSYMCRDCVLYIYNDPSQYDEYRPEEEE